MMMETGLFVRKAQQSDIPAILEIEWECFREDSFSKEQFAYLMRRICMCVVLLLGIMPNL